MAERKKEPSGFISLPQLSEYLNVNQRTLRGLINDGKLPAYQVAPRTTIINMDDVNTYLKSCRIAPGTITAIEEA